MIFKNAFLRLLEKNSIHLSGEGAFQRNLLYRDILESLVMAEPEPSRPPGPGVIVFSKDRPLQLHALLASYLHFVRPVMPVTILYAVSAPDMEKAYAEVQEEFSGQPFHFIRETVFRQDLLKVIRDCPYSRLFFLVDDMAFKAETDLNFFGGLDVRNYVPSLRMGNHLTYSYTTRKKQALPRLSPGVDYPGMFEWNWAEGEGDWAYPLSVDGHLFDTAEILFILEKLLFKAPNSLEHAMQIMLPLYQRKKGLCFGESRVLNNPCNKVQRENNNISGDLSAEELLAKWNEGYAIDFLAWEGLKNSAAHQLLPLKFRRR